MTHSGRSQSRKDKKLSRKFSRRLVELMAAGGAAVSCRVRSVFGFEGAGATDGTKGMGMGDYVFSLTTMVLDLMTKPPLLGTLLGYTAAQIWALIGIALVIMPNASKGI